MGRAVFFDRDGTINENAPGDYVLRLDDLVMVEGAPDSVARLCRAGFKVIIVTNQSAIGRGWLAGEDHDEIMRYVCWRIEQAGGKVAGVYTCPHAPDAGCDCRKPAVGLVEAALRDHPDIDVPASFFVGDSPDDMELARDVGLRSVYVLSGHGRHRQKELERRGLTPEAILAGVNEAVDYVVAH